MNDVYQVLADLAVDLPEDVFLGVATDLVAGEPAATAWGAVWTKNERVREFEAAANAANLSADARAVALRSAAAVAARLRRESKIDILWTGPHPASVPMRYLEQALCELIDAAKDTLWIVSFVAYKADKVYAAIRTAIKRGVRVSFLTESSREQGGTLDTDPVELLQKNFPKATFYRWNNESSEACVHAKCALADRKCALVASANLTGAAMEKNMELGLMVTDARVTGRLVDHFTALVTDGTLKESHPCAE